MALKWKPNPDAAPFLPSSAYYNIKLPCCQDPWRFRKKGLIGKLVQWTLVFILFVTVVINILFILDTTSKSRSNSQPPSIEKDNDFEERRNVVIGKTAVRG